MFENDVIIWSRHIFFSFAPNYLPIIFQMKTFIMMYRTHCQRILDTIISANFEEVIKHCSSCLCRIFLFCFIDKWQEGSLLALLFATNWLIIATSLEKTSLITLFYSLIIKPISIECIKCCIIKLLRSSWGRRF